MRLSDAEERHMSVFHPHALGEIKRLGLSGQPFVYYTRAATAVSIINGAEFWMRRASLMNDFSETVHGLKCLEAAYNSPEGDRFNALIESVHPGISARAKAALDQSAELLLKGTYLTSVSEHGHSKCKKENGQDEEDLHGRLSMWRGYGGATGVALILNPQPLFSTPISGVYFSPVGYFRDTGFVAELHKINEVIGKNKPYLRLLGPERTAAAIVNLFRFAVICAKHPGFGEEREWRVVCSDALGAPALKQTTETIDNVVQQVLHIPMSRGGGVPRMVKRIIVGPTKDPDGIRGHLVAALRGAGVLDPEDRVVKSDIPLRNWT
jgi:hypothetical protein